VLCGLGGSRRRIGACRQLSHRITQTSRTPARKVLASLSKRVAMPRYCLSFWKKRSTRLRSQYRAKSVCRGSLRLAFGGMTGVIPCASSVATRALES
jgi:hypothetical protein